MLILAHYGEIGLKGKNRGVFERILLENVRRALGKECKKAEIREKRILVEAKSRKALEGMEHVFGIEWFAEAERVEPGVKEIWGVVKKHGKEFRGKKIRVDAKRSDKGFPLTSMQVNERIGERMVKGLGCGVDLGNPEATVHAEIGKDDAFVYFEKVRGRGGLPVGSSGKVLCLFSGGIDSPVAAWMMMKRGCRVDFLHVHPFEKGAEVKGTKIEKIVKRLNEFQGASRILLIPYEEFYKCSFKLGKGYELVVFRRFLYKLAEMVAKDNGYKAVVSGDSLGQVASQTLENLIAAEWGMEVPVFRPLIGLDKMEIVGLSKKAGLYELSLGKYKDCCSLVAVKSPVTKAKREEVERLLGLMGKGELLKKSIGKLKVMEVE